MKNTPKLSYEGPDPRYGYVRIDFKDTTHKSIEIIVVDKDGLHYGFTFEDGQMEPTCICNAWSSSECSCTNVSWKDDDYDYSYNDEYYNHTDDV